MKLITKKLLRRIWIGAGLLFTAWNFISFQAHGVDEEIMTSTAAITVKQTDDFLGFIPQGAKRQVLIFFPGAMVDPTAYAPLARHVAEAGYATYIIKMPWRLATYGYKRINTLAEFADTTKQYVLGGHSQGAKMAAQYVYEYPGKMAGLILMGTSHPRDISLSNSTIPIMKVSATNDGLASPWEVAQNKNKLPAHTEFVVIEGGNHAQFGYYGSQLGDDTPTLSRAEQQNRCEQAIVRFLQHL
ncbi:alpha/beta hydrolase [Spirosoma aerolatum]|uniref:alpha/beta hydrolase n=1 Tax=Spirosoma aerolatum TaxID=1211326 RepID=UPI0009AD3892|nr:alpha/beta hydrolase [Spirosoma aerolatum]